MNSETTLLDRQELNSRGYWEIPEGLDTTNFDFNWRPYQHDRPYIHQFGTQHQRTGGPRYIVPEAEGVKYQNNQYAIKLPDRDRFTVEVDQEKYLVDFDWSWHPDDNEPPFVWIFGNQYLDGQVMPTVKYTVPGATDAKYSGDIIATLCSRPEHWHELHKISASFDKSWAPHPYEPPYIYVWGNQYLRSEQMPTVEYHMPGATERKYMHDRWARIIGDGSNWVIHDQYLQIGQVDTQWIPHPHEPPWIYCWGTKWVPAEVSPVLEYRTPGATERKYMGNDIETDREPYRWKILHKIDEDSFDFSFRPHPHDPPFVYVWGNQHYDAEVMPTVEYHVPGATQRKYMHTGNPKLAIQRDYWVEHTLIDTDKFDLSWVPHPHDPPYIYVWGNKWVPSQIAPTLEYRTPGAVDYKFMSDDAPLLPDMSRWKINIPIDKNSFDFTWRPDPREPAYIYVWGNQHYPAEEQPTVEYHAPGATEYKYMSDTIVSASYVAENWKILIDDVNFDWDWRPHPHDPPYIYVWGNQWNDAATEATVQYVVPGATEYKYMTDRVARVPDTDRHWTVKNKSDWPHFDWSWRPNPHSPPQIYQWPDGGPTYTVPGATAVVFMDRDHPAMHKTGVDMIADSGIKIPRYLIQTTLEDLISEHPDEVFWALNPYLSYDNFDFDWRPSAENFQHINVFGNELSKDTQTYYINGPMIKLGYKQLNYVNAEIQVDTKLDMFWIDTGSRGSDARYQTLMARYPNLQKTRFVNSWVATVNRCLRKATTDYVWILSSDYDYSDFKFDFYPPKWQSTMTHVFGTQWSHWGNVYLVNRVQFPKDTQYIEVIEHLNNINHVRNRKVVAAATKHDVLYIDFGNSTDTLSQLQNLDYRITVVPYTHSYLDTIKRWVNSLGDLSTKRDYTVWVTTSITDYSNFDWSWQCDPFQREQLHVFASRSKGNTLQKRGDTFMLNVCEFAGVMDNLIDLSQYTKRINYINHVTATRLPSPCITVDSDTLNESIEQCDPSWPYTEVVISNASSSRTDAVPVVWSESEQPVIVTSAGAASAYLPRRLDDIVDVQIYDYPHIITNPKLGNATPLDIVFISNGEPIADQNYEHLQQILQKSKTPNRLVRVNNIDGRIASQHAAANIADTSWYFLVNGKVRVRDDFDWSWQPDRLQQAKHYIFTVTNPVNGLEYGHQAIVANNRRLTLATTQPRGLDFTLDSLHSVVDINCGVAHYNTDPWTTWRTAFREVVKLQCNTDDVSKERLHAWLNIGNGDHGEWSTRGASDGVDFWHSVGGDLQQLLNSYDWLWLAKYYNKKYGDKRSRKK